MTPQEEREYGQQVAWDDYQCDLAELEMNLHEAAMKLVDKRLQAETSIGYKSRRLLDGLGLLPEDFYRWKNPPPPDSSLPF